MDSHKLKDFFADKIPDQKIIADLWQVYEKFGFESLDENEIVIGKQGTTLEYFFEIAEGEGASLPEFRDFEKVNSIYQGRIPTCCLAIGSLVMGDLLILDCNSGKIYYWGHENDDEQENPQVDSLCQVGESLSTFMQEVNWSPEPITCECANDASVWVNPNPIIPK